MVRTRVAKMVAYAGLVAAAPVLLGAAPVADFSTRALAAQNGERALLGVAPLRWDAGLARSAQSWADHLAATGAFAHAQTDPRDPQGENLWAGTRGRYSVEAMIDAWAREKRVFKPGAFPANSLTGRWQDVGHYTQLIWRDTRQVGCAVATGAREDVLVCRYSRAGNWAGERPF